MFVYLVERIVKPDAFDSLGTPVCAFDSSEKAVTWIQAHPDRKYLIYQMSVE